MAKENNTHLFVLGVIGVVAVLGLVMMLTGDKTGAVPINQMPVSKYPNIMIYPDDINPDITLGRAAASPIQQQEKIDRTLEINKKLGIEQFREDFTGTCPDYCKRGCTISETGVVRCI